MNDTGETLSIDADWSGMQAGGHCDMTEQHSADEASQQPQQQQSEAPALSKQVSSVVLLNIGQTAHQFGL